MLAARRFQSFVTTSLFSSWFTPQGVQSLPGSTIKVVNDSSSFALCRWTAAALELSFARQAFIFHAKLARDEILKMLPCSFAPIYSTRRTFRSSLSAEHFSWSFEKQNVFQVGPRDLQSRSIGCLPHAQARNLLSFCHRDVFGVWLVMRKEHCSLSSPSLSLSSLLGGAFQAPT